MQQQLLDDYIAAHISPEPPLLAQTYSATYLHHLYPHMCSGHVQGRTLKMLTAMIRPRRILELGAFTGYSTLCMAEGMPTDAHLHTIEIDDELEDELTARFAQSPAAERIHLHIGDAIKVAPTIDEHWDMVFIDANKRHYCQYFDLILPRVAPGGFIIIDNTLWDGKVIEQPTPTDAQSRGIMAFNDHLTTIPGIEVAIIPIRDGLTIVRKLPSDASSTQ